MNTNVAIATTIVSLACCPCHAQNLDLWDAIRRSRVDLVTAYLEDGGDPNARVTPDEREEPGWPLLQVALYDREGDIAVELLRSGADFDALEVSLDIVAGEGLTEALRFLLRQDPTRLSALRRERQADLLQVPASKGYYQAVELLLDEARDIGFQWAPGVMDDAVSVAIGARQDDIAHILLAEGARPTGTAIRVAARSSSPGMVRHLLRLGAEPTARLPDAEVKVPSLPRTPIAYAWRRYVTSTGPEREAARLILAELIRAGAEPETAIPSNAPRDGLAELADVDEMGARLVLAARLGFFDVVDGLVSGDTIDSDALREAAATAFRSLDNDIARRLIDAGAPLDGVVLGAAAAGNSPGLVRLMLQRGVDPNERVNGRTSSESWFERTGQRDLRAPGDYVLHELIVAGADVCWLASRVAQVPVFAANFLRDSATECWPGGETDGGGTVPARAP